LIFFAILELKRFWTKKLKLELKLL